jgi:hypothetical protein
MTLLIIQKINMPPRSGGVLVSHDCRHDMAFWLRGGTINKSFPLLESKIYFGHAVFITSTLKSVRLAIASISIP